MNSPVHKDRLLYLDGWRGIAILLVLFGHFAASPGINLGRLGVELFFVLSGRLMAEILFIKGTSLVEFYRRRMSRIYPALLVFVLAYTCYATFTGREDVPAQLIAASLLFYSNYLAALFDQRIPSMEHIWSLAVEEHEYMVLSLIMVSCARRSRSSKLIIATLALGALINAGVQTYGMGLSYGEVFWRSDVRMASILMSAALCIHFNQREPVRVQPYLLVLGLAGIALNVNAVPDLLKYSVGTLCLAIVVNQAGQLPAWTLKLLSNRILVLFGVASYSLYLWQQPFYKAMHGILSHPVMLAGALITGFLSYHLVEKPARRWLNGIPLRTRVHAGSKASLP